MVGGAINIDFKTGQVSVTQPGTAGKIAGMGFVAAGAALLGWSYFAPAAGAGVGAGGATAGAAAAGAQTVVVEGNPFIAIVSRTGVAALAIAGGASHPNLAQQAGLLAADGVLQEGYAAVTIFKEQGQVFVLGSQNFGGTLQVPDWAIEIVRTLFK
jgi:hypothetical protein